jgi:uncharacterized membrane protein YbhN (UPF0104 family)
MRFLKPLLGAALLVGLLSLTDLQALLGHFQKADVGLFALAVLLAIAANLLCVKRWQMLAGQLGIATIYPRLLVTYLQGITANSVLPGGILGGDAWRSLALSKQATEGAKHQAVISVLLDRVSGFWGLTWLSLFAGLVASGVLAGLFPNPDPNQSWLDGTVGQTYLLALLLITAAPFVGRLVHMSWLKQYEAIHPSKILQSIIRVINALPLLLRTLPHSFVVQLMTASAFWLCLLSVQVAVPWWLLTALCGGVFLSGVLPAALGGFGARELGAVAFITPFGFSKEGVLAGSILFGLTATIQGLLGLWFWFRPTKP